MKPKNRKPNKPNKPAKKKDDFVAPNTQQQTQSGQGPTAPPPAAGGGPVVPGVV